MQIFFTLKYLLILSAVSVLSGCVSRQSGGEVLFDYEGKSYRRADLPDDVQRKIFGIDTKARDELRDVLRDHLLNKHIAQTANEKKISEEKVRETFESKVDTSDEALKKYYDAHRDKLPYEFSTMKYEIESQIKNEAKNRTQEKILADALDRRKINVYLPDLAIPEKAIDVAGFPTLGKPDAKVQIIEFGDLTCPACQSVHADVKKILKEYEAKVSFTFVGYLIHKPQPSERFAKIGYCLDEQGLFWQFQDAVFANQLSLIFDPEEKLYSLVPKTDVDKLKGCVTKPEIEKLMKEGHAMGEALQISKTPTFFVNSRHVGSSPEGLRGAIERVLGK